MKQHPLAVILITWVLWAALLSLFVMWASDYNVGPDVPQQRWEDQNFGFDTHTGIP